MDKDAPAHQARFREGLALHRQGDLAGAEAIYREVLGRDGGHFDSLHMLGMIALQRRQTAEGIALVKQALARNGKFAAAHNNLGKGWLDLGQIEQALPCFEEAIACDPDFVEAHVNRAGVLGALRRLDEALASYRRAAALMPQSGELERNCGNALALMRRHPEAFAAYDKALRLDPELVEAEGYRFYAKMQLCDWEDWDDEIARLAHSARSGKASTQPFHFLALSMSPADQLACARAWVARHCPAEKPRWQGERYRHDRIRIAYVSADFREHAASMLMAGMFEHHDRSKFEVTAISLARDDGSEIGQRVRGAFEHFVDATSLRDDDVADLIKARETDIAVDLMGFTTKSRTGIFARRPAPVQAHYMGFPGTMGAPFIDYIIADGAVIPAEARASYSEKIVTLPDSYFVNDAKRPIAELASTRQELGLPKGGFVFCCFNSHHKITPRVFASWMRILRDVEGSVLWLLSGHTVTSGNLRKEAAARGVNPERLIFAPRMRPDAHLARHRAADLFLDTLPYNAHTTAADALWTGLPVVTLIGETFAGRVAASLLQAIGLPELIIASADAYEQLAIGLATNPDRLPAIKAKLAKHRLTMPLFDTGRFTRNMEAAFLEMHRRHQASLPPGHIAIPN